MQIVHSVTQLGVAVNAVNADSSVASHLNRSVGFFLVPSYREKKKKQQRPKANNQVKQDHRIPAMKLDLFSLGYPTEDFGEELRTRQKRK